MNASAIQLQPIESDDEIFYGVEIKDLRNHRTIPSKREMRDDTSQDCF